MGKKKLIKINFKYFWDNFDPENNFFTNLLSKEYEVVISDKPDYLFYSVFPEVKENRDLSKKGDFLKRISPRLYIFIRKFYAKFKNLKNLKRPLIPKGDFIRIFHGAEHIKPNMEECDWAFSTHFEEKVNHPNYMRVPAFMMSDYGLKNFGSPNLKRKINFKKIKKEKIKFCNFLYSQENIERNNFFKKLNEYKKIDSPGRCMNNMSPIGIHLDARKSRSSSNWVQEKLNFLNQYKFTIAFENVSLSGWTTEKLTHPLLFDSIPIYIGNKNVDKDFNTKCFINYNDFNNMEEFIKHIIKVDNDDDLYKEYLKQPIYLTKEAYDFSRTDRVEKRLKKIIKNEK